MNYVLHGAPLSEGFRRSLEATECGAAVSLTLAELRQLPLLSLVRKLRGLRAEYFVIAYERDSSYAIVPALLCIAAFARARQIGVFGPDLKLKTVSRFQAFKSLVAMAGSTIAGFYHMRRCGRQLRELAGQKRMVLPLSHESANVLYAKTNLSFGVTAGGSVGHVAGVTSGLLENGYSVDFLSVEPPAVIDSRVRCQTMHPPASFGLPYESNLYRYHNSFVKDALEVAKGKSYRFIYQRLSIGNYVGVALSRMLKVPLVLEYNGSEVWVSNHWTIKHRFPRLAENAEQVSLKHAHVIVTVSDVLKDSLLEQGVPAERIVTYPNCIDPEIYDPARFSDEEIRTVRQRHGIASDAVVVGFVGTFGQWHGVEVLAATIRNLALNHSDWLLENRVHFLLVGDGVRMADVREALSDEACRPFYTLTGLVPQMQTPAYLAAMDVLSSPHIPNADGSRFFGSPTKLFEYMAMGRAIVASNLEQIGDVLANSLSAEHLPTGAPRENQKELAVLCEPGNVAELEQALRFVIEQKQWRKNLGANALAEARQKYTWNTHVCKILDRLVQLGLIEPEIVDSQPKLVA